MATDPNTLLAESKCFICLGVSEAEAIELALLARIAGGSPAPPTPTPPAAPTNLLISPATTNGNIILNWTAGGAAPTTYEIWRSVNGGAFAQVGSVGGGITTFIHAAALAVADQWYYEVRACNGATCSVFTDPAGIFRDFQQLVDTGLLSDSFPFLQFHIGDLFVLNQSVMTTISLPKLHTISGDFAVEVNAALISLVTTNLITCFSFAVVDNPILPAISCPAMTQTTTGFFAFRTNALLASISFPLLSSVGGDIQGQDNPTLASASFPALVITGNGVNFGNSGITSLSLPLFTTMGVGFSADSCNSLVNVSIPVLIFQDGSTITFDSDILNVASVNQVLARGVASGTTVADYELNTPGNAAPAGQGLLDKATLIGAGNTVNTN